MASIRSLQKAMDNASSYDEWKEAAVAHDEKSGASRWRYIDQSRKYDYVSIRIRLDELRTLRARQDDRGLLFTLNEGIHGNMGGMGRPALWESTLFGTKKLIEDYVNEVAEALDHLADPKVSEISFEEKLDFFRRASHCFGQSAFMMSGSGSLLYFHIGVVKALCEQGLLPSVLSGSSGGSFVGALVSTHNKGELKKIFDPEYLVHEIKQEDRFFKHLSKLKPEIMPVDEIQKILERLIPDLTFQEACERTGRQLNISIAPAETHQKSRLLNAITSPNVFIREAIMASAAVPGVYPPVTLAAKNHLGEKQAYLPSRRWVDGSVSDDMPAKRLARLYGVNHYIVSQTNPHVIPFVTDSKRRRDAFSLVKDASIKTARAWYNVGATTLEKPLSLSPSLSRYSAIAQSIINQDYVGDINILPSNRFFNPFRLLAVRSVPEIMEMINSGEKATWPKIEMIRIQTRISRKLDTILTGFEDRQSRYIKAALRKKAS